MFERFYDQKGHCYAGYQVTELPNERRFKGGGKGGSKPKPQPAPAPLPPPPARTEAETTQLADEQRRRVVTGNASGRAGTFFTRTGVSEGSSAVRFLGGSSRT